MAKKIILVLQSLLRYFNTEAKPKQEKTLSEIRRNAAERCKGKCPICIKPQTDFLNDL